MNIQDRPYFMEIKEWYYWDEKEWKYKLTNKATKEAKESYDKFYEKAKDDKYIIT